MEIKKFLASLGLALALMLTSVAAFAGPHGGKFPFPGMHPAGMTSDTHHLYVLVGPQILQYSLGDLKLLKTVDLPKPTSSQQQEARPCPPPFIPGGGSPALWAGDGSLYVLAGPKLFRFSTPDLALKGTIELPKPEKPQPEQPQAGK